MAVDVALAQVEIPVAHHELHPKLGVAGMEAIEQPGLGDAIDDRLGAGDANDSPGLAAEGSKLRLEVGHGILDRLGIRKHLLAEVGQSVSGRQALYQRLADPALKR